MLSLAVRPADALLGPAPPSACTLPTSDRGGRQRRGDRSAVQEASRLAHTAAPFAGPAALGLQLQQNRGLRPLRKKRHEEKKKDEAGCCKYA